MRRAGNSVRTGILVAVVLAMATGAWAADAGQKPADRVLQMVPAESLFCVRINNLDGALSGATDFLTGIAPDGFNAGTMVTAKLGSMVGPDRMEQVRRRGNFTMFGVTLPDGEGNQNPFANLFTGMLVPVKDYDAFVGGDAPAGPGRLVTSRPGASPPAKFFSGSANGRQTAVAGTGAAPGSSTKRPRRAGSLP